MQKYIPYQYGQFKKGKTYWVYSRTELLVVIASHELMHVRQAKGKPHGRVWGARGQYSEIETEAYAIRKLREFRKTYGIIRTIPQAKASGLTLGEAKA